MDERPARFEGAGSLIEAGVAAFREVGLGELAGRMGAEPDPSREELANVEAAL
jgi:hypothetical protein